MTQENKPKGKRGRPAFKPTPALRKRVSVCAGGGMRHEEIALALGISEPTLRKHFEFELSVGAYQKRVEVLEAMHKAAKRGSVPAQRAYANLTPQVAAPPLQPPAAGDAVAPAGPPDPPKGKKEQANADAVTAAVGTDWDGLLKPPGTPTVQ